MNANQKLMQFIASVESNIQAESDAMLAAAKQEANEILHQANLESKELAQRQLSTAKKALALKYQRRLAQNSFQFHTAILRQRTRHLALLFSDLRQRVADFSSSSDYLPWLKNLLTIITPAAQTTILLRESDLQYIPELQRICPADCRFVADENITLGGCMILSADGKHCMNHTLDDALAEQIRNFHREQLQNGGNKA